MALNLIFLFIITLSVVFYIYNKVVILRMKDELMQRYTNAKARIFLGSFLFFFGVNQYYVNPVKIILIISIIFVLIGGLQMFDGFKEAKHYRGEWKRLNPKEAK